MEKLIELLNEYENTLEPNEQIEWTENGVKATPLTIISKQYGFIKWLVENEKIDLYKIPEIGNSNPDYIVGEVEVALMELAIQDNPIEFLVSILK